jgi:hypothetical protein
LSGHRQLPEIAVLASAFPSCIRAGFCGSGRSRANGGVGAIRTRRGDAEVGAARTLRAAIVGLVLRKAQELTQELLRSNKRLRQLRVEAERCGRRWVVLTDAALRHSDG